MYTGLMLCGEKYCVMGYPSTDKEQSKDDAIAPDIIAEGSVYSLNIIIIS